MKPFNINSIFACAAALVIGSTQAIQAVILDDFNVNEGHFNQTITFSGTTVGEDATSTADRVTTDGPREGAGHQRLVLVHDATTTPFRLRHVSGAAAPANNTAFVTTAGTDGYIGFYLKTTNTGWETSINLDGPGNTIAEMDGSTSLQVIADGEWHLYEWDLDSITDWGAVPAIGGGHGGALVNGSHTVDSIYLRDLDGEPGPTAVIYLDFVAINPNGSVAELLQDPCINTTGVLVTGPLATNSNQVVVAGVSATATAVNVYQQAGSAPVLIGTKTTGLTEGDNTVTVTGLIKGAQVAATQTVGGQESCVPPSGTFVGGGANPSIRLALSIRETAGSGPIGEPNPTPISANIHFLGATALSGGAPVNASVFYPSNDWQTVTFSRGTNEAVADPTTAAGVPVNGSGYNANDYVALQVYAYRSLPNGTTIFSVSPAYVPDFSSNDVFNVNWSWDPVAGADGYRLLRSYNFAGHIESVDVTATSYSDTNGGWTTNTAILPNTAQSGRSVKWNTGSGDPVGTTNNLPGQWGVLEAVALVIDGDVGPFDFYIDSLQNGDTVFQTFDQVDAGTADVGFRAPGFSGSTSSALLSAPQLGAVSANAADTGTNSFRVVYQWNGTNASKWVRLTTSGVGDPQVDLDQPISFRLLLQPVGSSISTPPGPLSISREGGNVILNWVGTFQLQSSGNVVGPYTNVTGVTTAPYTNAAASAAQFFRLSN